MKVSARVRRMLIELTNSLQMELSANDADEIRGNPILKSKQQLADRAERLIATLDRPSPPPIPPCRFGRKRHSQSCPCKPCEQWRAYKDT